MNSSGNVSRLGIKVTVIAFITLMFALWIFILICEVAVPRFLYSERFNDYWSKKEAIVFEDFQSYVTENEMTMWAAIQDADWKNSYHTVYLCLEKYDPESVERYGAEKYAEHEIQCSDGVVYAFFYPSANYYFNIGRVIALGIAIACFFLIFVPYVYRVVHRITQLSRDMEILAGGDLSYKIISTGRDELAELGRNIEGMRCSVLEQMARENESVLANNQLITSLSHDLRTPLTKLTGYLEILQYKKYKSEAEHDSYLSKALDKAQQMQFLSDEMFRNFQVKQVDIVVDEKSSFTSIKQIVKIIADQSSDLQLMGFNIQPLVVENNYLLNARIEDIRRVFDNLFSNLKKYADPAYPIDISSGQSGNMLWLSMKNYIRTTTHMDSRGIGIPIIQMLMLQNSGKMDITQSDNIYSCTLWFQKVE